MRTVLTSILVDDQDKALKFYTEKLGFIKKQDFPVGDFKWLTLVSPEGHDDMELALEPAAQDFAVAFQTALYERGIPATAFASRELRAEYERLRALGVTFRGELTEAEGMPTTAMFDDTCGNLIQIFEA